MSAAACVGWFVIGAMAGGTVTAVALALLVGAAENRRHYQSHRDN